jgi:hypothetical protein
MLICLLLLRLLLLFLVMYCLRYGQLHLFLIGNGSFPLGFIFLMRLIRRGLIQSNPIETHPTLPLAAKLSISVVLIVNSLFLMVISAINLILKSIKTVVMCPIRIEIIILYHNQVFPRSAAPFLLSHEFLFFEFTYLFLFPLYFSFELVCLTSILYPACCVAAHFNLLVISVFLLLDATLACRCLFQIICILKLVKDERATGVV